MQNKKAKQAKDKRSATKALGTLQTDYKKKVPSHMLYVWQDGSGRFQLTHRPHDTQSQLKCVLKIRLTNPSATMLPLQYKSLGEWSRLLLKNAKGNRRGSNAKTTGRQTSKRKSDRLVHWTGRTIPTSFERSK